MKKESVIILVVAAGAVAFLLGRVSVSTRDKPAAAGAPAAAPAAAPVVAAAAPPPAVGAAAPQVAPAAAAAPTAAPTAGPPAAAAKAAEAAPAVVAPRGSTNVMESPRKGPADAKVTIMEISDFQCPFCSKVGPTLKQIAEAYPKDVAVVWKNNPLSFHAQATPAALAAMAAGKQGKFWEMHDKVFANQQSLNDESFKKWAGELGLDAAKFDADRADPKLKAQILNEQSAAVALGQGGTPAFLINGKALSGAQPFEAFKTEIDNEIKAVDELIAKGTAPAKVHEERAKANLGANVGVYLNSLIGGMPAPRPKPPVDPTVWKVELQGHEPIKGKADAPVSVVIFSDFQCPFCSKVVPTLKQIEEKYKDDVRIVWKHNALPFHNRAKPAALATIAANEQGKFWEMHDKLFANQQKLEDADLEGYAKELGLDLDKYKKTVADPKSAAIVEKDMAIAEGVNARGTPNFFINGRNLRGAQPFESFESLLDEEIASAKKLIAAGTAAKDVYAKVTGGGKTFEPLDPKVNELTYTDRPFLGNKDGDVVIVEASDFECPYCSRMAPAMEELAKKLPRVKLVFKHFPLSFHKKAEGAALASIAAHQQGKFWEFSHKLFENAKELTEENFSKWAGEVGLDVAKFKADYADPKTKAILKQDMDELQKAGIQGTPSVYINGRKFEGGGGMSPEAVQSVIDKYLPKK